MSTKPKPGEKDSNTRWSTKTHPEDWSYLTSKSDPVLPEWAINMIANQYLRAYPISRDGVHFWRAWLALRKTGQPIPERMLKYVDEMAERLCRARGPKEISKAVEMAGSKGGITGVSRANAEIERRTLMVEIFMELERQSGNKPELGSKPRVPDAVMHAVARKNGTTTKALKVRWGNWWRNPKREQERTDAIASLSSVWNARMK